MASHRYTVAADFRVRADAIDAMQRLIAEGCRIYHWSQGTDDPALFLLYMEWSDEACFKAHVAAPHVKRAEDHLEREKMLVEPSRERHFYRV